MTAALIIVGLIALGVAALYLARGPLIENASPMPRTLGLQNGRLAPCAQPRNCASSYETQAPAAMQPIAYTGTAEQAQARLLRELQNMDRMTVVTNQAGYIHAISRTPVWGFIDDNEFVIADGKIHFKAAARLGQGDGGANRARLEQVARAMGR